MNYLGRYGLFFEKKVQFMKKHENNLYKNINLFENKDYDIDIDLEKTIFGVGAGISHDSPTGIPLGDELTNAFLKKLLGPEFADTFIEYWNEHIPKMKNAIHNGHIVGIGHNEEKYKNKKGQKYSPRLEYVIGEFSKLDNEFSDFHFYKEENNRRYGRKKCISALRHFADTEPNNNHMLLAECARAGATIITTNFDVCIEKTLGVETELINNPTSHLGVNAISFGEANNQYVYHIHGVATDDNIEENLGTTVRKVSEPSPKSFCKMIKDALDRGFCMVFLGYSGSDFFDVGTFFDELVKDGETYGRGIYVDHCFDIKMAEERILAEKKYMFLLQPFLEQQVCYGLTENVLKSICSKAGLRTEFDEPLTDVKAFEKTENSLEGTVPSYIDADRDYYFLNLFRLTSQLNINPGHFCKNWASTIEEICKDWEDDGTDTIDRMFSTMGQLNDSIVDDIRFNNWKSHNPKYLRIAKKMNKHTHSWENRHKTNLSNHMGYIKRPAPDDMLERYVADTCRILENGITDAKDADIQRDTMMYFYSRQIKKWRLIWLKVPMLRNYCNKQMKRLVPYYERLLNFSFNRFMYRTYYLYPMRFLNLMHAMMGDIESNEDGLYGDFQHEWDICMETPDLFDARRTIENRLEQIKILRKRGVKTDAMIKKNLKAVLHSLKKMQKDIWFRNTTGIMQ